MNLFCMILGHTWVHEAQNPDLRWNTSKGLTELEATELGDPYRFILRCQRCGERDESPSPERIRKGL